MNILPKKSWHVRTKKNIDRIRRDEAEAERANKLEQDRILHVEQEVRMRELRARAGISEPEAKHFNLFEDYEEKQKTTNEDNDAETSRDEAIQLQRLGIFNKLGRSEDANQPWYCATNRSKANQSNPKDELSGQVTKISFEAKGKEKSKSNQLISSIYDPMTAIREAEEIVKLKRREERQRQLLSGAHSGKVFKPLDFISQGTPNTSHKREHSSSPEIVDEIGPQEATELRKRKKKSKKSHKHRKSHKSRKSQRSKSSKSSRHRHRSRNRSR